MRCVPFTPTFYRAVKYLKMSNEYMITNKEWIMRIDQLLMEVIKSKASSIPPHLNTDVAKIKQIK